MSTPEYRASHRDHIRVKNALWYATNRQKVLAEKREEYAADPGRIRKKNRDNYLKHQETRRAAKRAYHAANLVAVKASNRQWRERNKGWLKRWHREHPGKYAEYSNRRRSLELGADGTHTAQEWADKCALLGNVCFYCGEAKPLTEDHNIPLSRGGSNYISNILPACQSCNSRKRTSTGAEFLARRMVA